MTNFTGEKEQLCLTRRFDIPRQNACASYQNQWCAPAQSKESPRGNSTGEVARPYRLERLGKIIACLGHALWRRATALRRKPLGLRAAIPGSDGKAERRLHRTTVDRYRD